MTGKLYAAGRAVRGALAGFLLGLVAGPFVFTESLAPDKRFLIIMATVGAVFGVTVGTVEIRGKARASVQGILYGAIAGILVGYSLGSIAGKFGIAPGIFVGLLVGAIFGGYLGAEFHPKSKAGVSSTGEGGVRDRDLDG